MNIQEDFSCMDAALYFSNCAAHYFASDEYEQKYPQKNIWWNDKSPVVLGGQRIHVIVYLGSCWKLNLPLRDSMKHVWSKKGFKNAAGLIWMLEALGADESIIQRAVKAGEKAAQQGRNQPQQCCAVKDEIGWDEFRKLLLRHQFREPMKS